MGFSLKWKKNAGTKAKMQLQPRAMGCSVAERRGALCAHLLRALAPLFYRRRRNCTPTTCNACQMARRVKSMEAPVMTKALTRNRTICDRKTLDQREIRVDVKR